MGGVHWGTGAVTTAPSSVPVDEVGETAGLRELAEQVDRLLVLEGVVERGHGMAHLDIRYDSTLARSVSERAVL